MKVALYNSDVLKAYEIGSARRNTYASRSYIDTQSEVSRSENKMGLQIIETSSAKIAKSLKNLVARSPSTKKRDLEKSSTKAQLLAEFTDLVEHLNDEEKSTIPANDKSAKDKIVSTLSSSCEQWSLGETRD
jgi:seryl-tRNA synthetase